MIDLHCHTSISDNSFTTEEVIAQARTNGVTHLAVTNHDTTVGLTEAMRLGEQYGVEIIPGIEISAYDYKRNRRAHILGLYVTPGHDALYELCQPLVEKRHEASRQMVQQIIRAGYGISWEEVEAYAAGGTGVYKQHIMHALLDKGYTSNIYGELYKKLFARGDALNPPGIAYVPIQYIDAVAAIRAIRAAGGIPVLAHPGQFNNFQAVGEWVTAGLEGIEVKHPLHGTEHEEMASELARQYGLVQTGGSDFHGFYGDSKAALGSKSMGLDTIEQLKQRLEEMKEQV